jgi:hypothetical protein
VAEFEQKKSLKKGQAQEEIKGFSYELVDVWCDENREFC